jgi:hypothetical protein
VLFSEEVAQRQQTRLQRASRDAGFPFRKTVDDFNFTYQSTVRMPLIGSDLSADFVTEGRSLILHGKPVPPRPHRGAVAVLTIPRSVRIFIGSTPIEDPRPPEDR